MRLSAVCFFTVCGFGMGWMSATLFLPHGDVSTVSDDAAAREDSQQDASVVDGAFAMSNQAKQNNNAPEDVAKEYSEAFKNNPAPQNDATADSFAALLNAGRFSQAIDLLSRVRGLDEREFAQMRQFLLSFLDGLMSSKRHKAFTELVDAYLADHYDDIDILLVLAEFNKRNDFYFEAVAVFDLADEYAYAIDNKTQVTIAFSRFLIEVDTYLVDRDDWYRLSQVYFQAEIAGLLSADQRVRQAIIYLKNGDIYGGKKILTDLQISGDLNDKGEGVLASLNTGDIKSDGDLSVAAASYTSGIPLTLSGNQFLIEVGLDSDQPTVLLIDTGASMTTLSRSGFDKVRYGIDAREIGTRMFSTANGLTKGYVYKVAEFAIGQYRLANVDIAVLDFDMGENAEGLLGMNVLSQFKFHFDQEKPQLLLKLR